MWFGLTNCEVVLVATYGHLSAFARPGIRGSFADGEVCPVTQSPYYGRAHSPILIVYKKCNIFYIIITDNTSFDTLNQIEVWQKSKKEALGNSSIPYN